MHSLADITRYHYIRLLFENINNLGPPIQQAPAEEDLNPCFAPTPDLQHPRPQSPDYPMPEIIIPIVRTPSPVAKGWRYINNIVHYYRPVDSRFWSPLTTYQKIHMVPDTENPGWAWIPGNIEDLYGASELRYQEHMMEYGIIIDHCRGTHFPESGLEEELGKCRECVGCILM